MNSEELIDLVFIGIALAGAIALVCALVSVLRAQWQLRKEQQRLKDIISGRR